jgi:hypothetical protein
MMTRGSVRSTRGLGPTMTMQGQSIGISIGMLPQTLIMSRLDQLSRLGTRIYSEGHLRDYGLTSLLGWHGGDYGTKDIQVLHYGIWPWRRILNGACISISYLPENIAWQTHRPEVRGLGRSPHLPPSNAAPDDDNHPVKKYLVLEHINYSTFLVCESFIKTKKCNFLNLSDMLRGGGGE